MLKPGFFFLEIYHGFPLKFESVVLLPVIILGSVFAVFFRQQVGHPWPLGEGGILLMFTSSYLTKATQLPDIPHFMAF